MYGTGSIEGFSKLIPVHEFHSSVCPTTIITSEIDWTSCTRQTSLVRRYFDSLPILSHAKVCTVHTVCKKEVVTSAVVSGDNLSVPTWLFRLRLCGNKLVFARLPIRVSDFFLLPSRPRSIELEGWPLPFADWGKRSCTLLEYSVFPDEIMLSTLSGSSDLLHVVRCHVLFCSPPPLVPTQDWVKSHCL